MISMLLGMGWIRQSEMRAMAQIRLPSGRLRAPNSNWPLIEKLILSVSWKQMSGPSAVTQPPCLLHRLNPFPPPTDRVMDRAGWPGA